MLVFYRLLFLYVFCWMDGKINGRMLLLTWLGWGWLDDSFVEDIFFVIFLFISSSSPISTKKTTTTTTTSQKKVYVYDLLVGKYTKFLITIYIKRTKQNQTRAKHITYTHTQLLQVEKQQQQQKKKREKVSRIVCVGKCVIVKNCCDGAASLTAYQNLHTIIILLQLSVVVNLSFTS